MKNLILWCNINSLCLRHHWSWQQHLNKICWFCSSFLFPKNIYLKIMQKVEYLQSNDFFKIMFKVDVCKLYTTSLAGIISANFSQIGITAHVNIDCWLYIFWAYLKPSLIIYIIDVNSVSPWWERKLNLKQVFSQIRCIYTLYLCAERNADSVLINFILQ